MRSKLVLFVLGLVLGFGAAQLVPGLWHRWAPAPLRAKPTVGRVSAKGLDDGRLLLTIVTPEGASLATFSKRVEEIDLLVEEGDEVALGLGRYRPFVEDPAIERVVKAGTGPPPSAPAATGTSEPGAAPPPGDPASLPPGPEPRPAAPPDGDAAAGPLAPAAGEPPVEPPVEPPPAAPEP